MGEGTIWLTGMMGAGKSRVGAALAARLGLPFFDLDVQIEREAGCGVPEIFSAQGEAGFRSLERKLLERFCKRSAVVALGGGTLTQPGAAERIRGGGRVIYLRARPETLMDRLGSAEGRPLLRGLDPSARLERLEELLAGREAAYACAEIVVDTDDISVDEVAERLAGRLAESG